MRAAAARENGIDVGVAGVDGSDRVEAQSFRLKSAISSFK